MSSLNVFRYSALAAGIIYGAYHTETLKSIGAKKQEAFDFEQKQKLISEAKAEYKKLNPPKVSTTTEAINLDDPDFDFAKFVLGAVDKLAN
ncbi:hypothetical protein CANARDRAFT_28173 [[Candida] arabinofermentans NRRL YB-2248]|uniref:ATP synthase F(0) complex subunit e, mitochondrial n=1 Tax=[Candida] arabinofermentans NRRL YB-2248 TaxID=983967 RepID=A0A1E4T0V2_9ASCO|nr:hypothetical protein CANARDRAFT_28173 [[Candida] arabinofermentans NRRL YB-2248]